MDNSEKQTIFDILDKVVEQLPDDNPNFKKLKQKVDICKQFGLLTRKFEEAIDKEVGNDCLQAAIIGTHIAMTNIRLLTTLNPSAPQQAMDALQLMLKEYRSTFKALLELYITILTNADDQSFKANPELN